MDEYDKPILDALGAPEAARANRDFLRGVYSAIEDSDAHVRFTFLTGVSRFSKVSPFFGLDNPTDITLDPRCSAICDYTEADLDTVFAPVNTRRHACHRAGCGARIRRCRQGPPMPHGVSGPAPARRASPGGLDGARFGAFRGAAWRISAHGGGGFARSGKVIIYLSIG